MFKKERRKLSVFSSSLTPINKSKLLKYIMKKIATFVKESSKKEILIILLLMYTFCNYSISVICQYSAIHFECIFVKGK